MSWRTGSKLFIEIWPTIRANIPDRQRRIEFTGELLQVFAHNDIDVWDVEDVDPDVRDAIRVAGLDEAEDSDEDEDEA